MDIPAKMTLREDSLPAILTPEQYRERRRLIMKFYKEWYSKEKLEDDS